MSLPIPVGAQHRVVFLPADGHQVVLGTAGTGKTTMAMLRADHLARSQTRNAGRVLLVTYNNALVTYLKFLKPDAPNAITVETYGRFARGYLNSHGLMPSWGGIATPAQRRTFVTQALNEARAARVGQRPSAVLSRDVAFFLDELEWISGMGLKTVEEYVAARRFGRESPLSRVARERVWGVLVAYRRFRDGAGPVYDWYDLATAVRTALSGDTGAPRYKHIVIDEGQDLSPEQVRSLVEAVPPDGSVTFFGDYHQAIYGQGLSWRACGLDVVKRPVERFADNYRNTGEIARLAIALAESDHMKGDVEDLVVPQAPKAAGPLPTLVHCKDRDQEIEVVIERAMDLSPDRRVAVLARTWVEAQRATKGLTVRKLDPEMKQWQNSPGIYIGAYHSAKGLEFDAVILPFLNTDRLPLPELVAIFGEEEASAREARLLYVAITRARTDIIMTYSDTLTPLLPRTAGLILEVTP